MSDLLMLIAVEAAHGAAGHGETAEHAVGPSVWGLGPVFWVSLAMLILIGIMIWKKVPALVAGMLDAKIAGIRAQLDEATALRKEAEALRDEYQGKLAALESEAKAMHDRATQEAALVVAKAEEDAAALIARRQRMAEDRIAAAERSAVAEVRDTASRAAVAAAAQLIAEGHTSAADKPLIERAIADIAKI